MKIQTKKSVKLIILSVVFALCLSFGIFYGNIETKSAYAATTPLYKKIEYGAQNKNKYR